MGTVEKRGQGSQTGDIVKMSPSEQALVLANASAIQRAGLVRKLAASASASVLALLPPEHVASVVMTDVSLFAGDRVGGDGVAIPRPRVFRDGTAAATPQFLRQTEELTDAQMAEVAAWRRLTVQVGDRVVRDVIIFLDAERVIRWLGEIADLAEEARDRVLEDLGGDTEDSLLSYLLALCCAADEDDGVDVAELAAAWEGLTPDAWGDACNMVLQMNMDHLDIERELIEAHGERLAELFRPVYSEILAKADDYTSTGLANELLDS